VFKLCIFTASNCGISAQIFVFLKQIVPTKRKYSHRLKLGFDCS